MHEPKMRVNITMRPSQHRRLHEAADKYHTTASAIISEAVDDYLDKQNNKAALDKLLDNPDILIEMGQALKNKQQERTNA